MSKSIKYATLFNGLRMQNALVSRPGDGEREIHQLDFCERGVENWRGDWQNVTAEFEEAVTDLYRQRQMDAMDNSQTPIFDPATGALTGEHVPYVLADYVMLSQGWRPLVLMQRLKASGFGLGEGEGRLLIVKSQGTGKPAAPGYGWSWIEKPPVAAGHVNQLSDKITVRSELRQGMTLRIHVQCADPPPWPSAANDWILQGELVTDDGSGPVTRFQLPEIKGVGAWTADVPVTSLADEITDLDWHLRWTSVSGTPVDVGGEIVAPNFTPTVSFSMTTDR